MKAIVAADPDWGIGKDGNLLAHIPEDMKYFRNMTAGAVLIMGRKTLESFPGGKPLKNRVNIVITRNPDYQVPGAETVHSAAEAAEAARRYPDREVFVAGGGEIYKEMLPLCGKVYVTKIGKRFDADTFFPDLDRDPEWTETDPGEPLESGGIPYRFTVYSRTGDVSPG